MPNRPIFKLLRFITVAASARIVMARLGCRPLCTMSEPRLKSRVTASAMSVTKMPTRAGSRPRVVARSLAMKRVRRGAGRLGRFLARPRLAEEPARPLPPLGRVFVHGRFVALVFNLPRPLVGESFDRHDFLLLRSAVT